MPNVSWTDLNRDGSRLETNIKMVLTTMNQVKPHSLKLAYFDRYLRASHEKAELAKIVLRVEELFKNADRQAKLEPEVRTN